MQVAAPYCLLCGCPCADPDDCRVTDASAAQDLLRARCLPTAFHYRAALAVSPAERYPLCMPCVSWARRNKKKRPRAPRVHTPLDGAILHALAPGHFPEPDQRCLARLAKSAADPGNGFAALVPPKLRPLLQRAGRADFVSAWWDANQRTAFFRHPETARAVRHCLVSPDASQDGSRRRWRR